MISRAQLKSFSLAFSLVLLSGCAVQEINKMGKVAREDGNNAQRIMQKNMSLSQPTVTWTNKQWVNLNPVSRPLTVAENKNVPDCNIVINQPEGISLPEIGQRISISCGIRVSITPDAFASLSTGSGAMSPRNLFQENCRTLPITGAYLWGLWRASQGDRLKVHRLIRGPGS
jgi:hypothetical protein